MHYKMDGKFKKKNENYIFSKRKGKVREVYMETFLNDFLKNNLNNDQF